MNGHSPRVGIQDVGSHDTHQGFENVSITIDPSMSAKVVIACRGGFDGLIKLMLITLVKERITQPLYEGFAPIFKVNRILLID